MHPVKLQKLTLVAELCTPLQELQRFPKLHSQLVEVVSELLRERLGPTSDYTTSLISIQAAYINTNHPAFVAGSANIAREGAQKHQPAPSHVPSIASEGDDDENSVDHNVEDMLLNGNSGQQRESRSVSETMHDRSGRKHRASANAVDGPSTSSKAHHGHDRSSRRGQDKGSALQVQQQQQQQQNHQQQGAGAKESFLNYFFGGQPGAEGHSSVLASSFDNRGSNAVTHRGFGGGASDILPELSARNGGHNGGVIGRFDQPQSTFDMKSLGKHLEPSPADPEHPQLSMREEMETNLIRSLICSYFAIVRQTIQDLVPKAVMHVRPGPPSCDRGWPLTSPLSSCSSTSRAKTSSHGSSRASTSPTCLPTCSLRTTRWSPSARVSRPCSTRTRRPSSASAAPEIDCSPLLCGRR